MAMATLFNLSDQAWTAIATALLATATAVLAFGALDE